MGVPSPAAASSTAQPVSWVAHRTCRTVTAPSNDVDSSKLTDVTLEPREAAVTPRYTCAHARGRDASAGAGQPSAGSGQPRRRGRAEAGAHAPGRPRRGAHVRRRPASGGNPDDPRAAGPPPGDG